MSDSQYQGHKDARRPKSHILTWLSVFFLITIVICCNYVSCFEYGRKDLTEEQRYTISERTVNVLSSPRVQNREKPVRIIFAFKRSTPNYSRMRSLLDEYERHSNGKVEVECFDPVRQPNRAREISKIYGVDFNQNLCVVDARDDQDARLGAFSSALSERSHVRICPGTSFVKYEKLPDETRRAVALMMDEVVCSALTEAVEGTVRHMYVVEGKGGVSRDNPALTDTLAEITASLNIQLDWIDIANVQALPNDAEGLLIIAPTTDFTEAELGVLNEFWNRDGRNAIFVALDPLNTDLPYLYSFLKAQGVRPNKDFVLQLGNNRRAYDEIMAVFPKSLNCARSFWNGSTQVEGYAMSFTLEHASENEAAMRRLSTYPLLMTTPDYYGETRDDRNPKFDPAEDTEGPLCLEAAVTRGDPKNPNDLSTLIVLGNINMLEKANTRAEQRDYMRTIWAWMCNRPEYSGKSSNQDLTVKIDLNRHSRHALEMLTLLIMPMLALLVALCLWNIRRH